MNGGPADICGRPERRRPPAGKHRRSGRSGQALAKGSPMDTERFIILAKLILDLDAAGLRIMVHNLRR